MTKEQIFIYKEISKQITALDLLDIPWSKKGTCYIALSYEFFNMGHDLSGIELLNKIPQSYFDENFKEELQNEDFLEVVLLLIDFMMKSQFVEKSIDLKKIYLKFKN